ncbi:hypothetical protein JOM56_010008 [Amanita muscaria]
METAAKTNVSSRDPKNTQPRGEPKSASPRAQFYHPVSTGTTTFSSEGATLATTKISTSAAKGKDNSVKILDLTKFETLHGSEESLSQAQWFEAVRNYIRFFDSLDQESLSQRWEDHFGFFEEREDLVENFNAILILDIKMRKDYVAQPFSFSMQYYALELEKMIRDTQATPPFIHTGGPVISTRHPR